MSDYVKQVNGEELKAMIAAGKTVVCDFFANWCGPCRMLAPVIETLAKEFEGRAEFVKLNIDDNTETAIGYGVMSIPDIFIFAGGGVKTHSVGYAPEEKMRSFFSANL